MSGQSKGQILINEAKRKLDEGDDLTDINLELDIYEGRAEIEVMLNPNSRTTDNTKRNLERLRQIRGGVERE